MSGTTAEADADGDVITPGEGDILNQQAHHALALAVGSLWVIPQPREVSSEGEDPVLLFGIQLVMILLKGTQFLIPLRFQDIGHQTAAGIDLHEPTSGQIGVVAGPLHLLPAQSVGFADACVELSVDLQGYLEAHWRDHLEEQLADGPIDVCSPVRGLAQV